MTLAVHYFPFVIYVRIMLSLLFILFTDLLKGSQQAVEFISPPSNLTASVGSNASFSCEISGTQTPGNDVQFYKVEPSQQLIGYNEDVKNETKYSVNGMYSYSIRDISLNDEGKYECILFPKSVAAYLTVAVPPSVLSLTWDTEGNEPMIGSPVNLTCSSRWSKPPARIKWYKNDVELKHSAIDATTTYTESGFRDTLSFQQLLLTNADNNSTFKCVVDLADVENVTSTEITVQLLSPLTLGGNVPSRNPVSRTVPILTAIALWVVQHE